MPVKTYGSALIGIDAICITVEVNISSGLHYFIVGLPDSAVKESMVRIESALSNSGFHMPRQKIVVNMAPADIRKEGSSYDLAIAIAILAESKQLNSDRLNDFLIIGELSLDGGLQAIKGALPITLQAKKDGFKGILLPEENAREAAIVDGFDVFGVRDISQVISFLAGELSLDPTIVDTYQEFRRRVNNYDTDFSDVKGQENIKRALEIAAAGGHNVILIGPPGAGKTMLAKRLPTILPPLNLLEALDTTKIHSVAGRLASSQSIMTVRPFCSPHHTISDIALVGGGSNPQPGEISLAHHGVLFLDELPEFKRTALEVMRQPLEERRVTISRSRMTVNYPANFMLVASMNPCPCGYYNHPEKQCTCNPGQVQKYLSRVSGPLLDRIDLHVEVTPVNFSELSSKRVSETSAEIRSRVCRARDIQLSRFSAEKGVFNNAHMSPNMVRKICRIDESGHSLLKQAMERLGLSARAFDRILKVARTIADLASASEIGLEHLAEAIHYRSLDRENWSG